MAFDFSLTTEGLNTPRLVDARARVVELWRERYGEDAQTGSDSPDGLMIDTLAILLDMLWQGNGAIWDSSFFRTATGVALDLVLDLVGKTRLDAASSTASVVWYGSDATVVPITSVLSVDDTDVRFATDAEGTTGGDIVGAVTIESTDDDTYRVTINGTDFDEASVGQTKIQIRDALIATINGGGEPVTAISGGTDPVTGDGVIILDADDGVTTFTLVATTLGSGTVTAHDAVRIAMSAEATGALAASATLLRNIQTSVSGIVGAVNTTDAILGRDRENDEDFRQRHLDTLNALGSASARAIRSGLLTNVLDVTDVTVRENRGDIVDANGLPPHSFEAIVLGGAAADIAAEIYDKGAAGIETHGDVETLVPDGGGVGISIPIRHTVPTNRFLHLRITITQGEGYPTTGDPATTIRDAVAAFYAAPNGDGALRPGSDFLRFSAATPINTVPGVASALVETDDTPLAGDSPIFTNSDIVVLDDEVLISDSSRITILGA